MKMTKKGKLYVVMGSTGEYSDHSEWLVYAFENEDDAKWWVERATEKANEWKNVRNSRHMDPPGGWNPYDPHMHMDYTGTNYYIEEVEMLEDKVIKFARGGFKGEGGARTEVDE